MQEIKNGLGRRRSPYGAREKVARVLWGLAQAVLFRLSFHNWYGWRRWLLRAFGASVHSTVRIRRTVRIECPWNLAIDRDAQVGDGVTLYCLGRVAIGERVTISQGAHVCAGTHDYNDPRFTLIRATVTIERHAWIAADAFVGPFVVAREGAVLGARAVAMKSLEAWTVYSGNPARPVKERTRFDS